MPLKKIKEKPAQLCLHPEHDPPNAILIEPGTYEYTCPQCGHMITFTVDGYYC